MRVCSVRSNGPEDEVDLTITVGSTIAGRYCVIEQIGEGAFSRVFECNDQTYGKRVAVKVMRNDKACFDTGLGEIRVLSLLQREHGSEGRTPYGLLLDYFYYKEHLVLVLERLDASLACINTALGKDLTEYYQPSRLAFIAFQLLNTLQLVHGANVVHCDIKPQNVCFDSISQCTVKLIDFGSCVCKHDVRNSYVQSRWYRAPEVMLGMSYDEKIDVWGLGCVMAELLIGAPLFRGATVAQVLAAQQAVLGPYPPSMISRLEEDAFKPYLRPDHSPYEIDPPGMPRGVYALHPMPQSLSEVLPTDDELTLDFITSLLKHDPAERSTVEEALRHPFISTNVKGSGRGGLYGPTSLVSKRAQPSLIEATPSPSPHSPSSTDTPSEQPPHIRCKSQWASQNRLGRVQAAKQG